jgi:hypothetical protein
MLNTIYKSIQIWKIIIANGLMFADIVGGGNFQQFIYKFKLKYLFKYSIRKVLAIRFQPNYGTGRYLKAISVLNINLLGVAIRFSGPPRLKTPSN